MLLVVVAMVRRSVGGILLVALAAALLLGGALGALAGARRSADAIDRAVAYSTPEDAFVGSMSGEPFDQAAIEALPEVQAAMYQAYVALVPLGADGDAQLDLIGSINPYLYVPASGPVGAINRLRILEGRDLDPNAPFEVVIDEELAANAGLHVGSQLPMGTYSLDQMDSVFGSERGASEPEPEGPPVDLEVVGITRMPVDVHPDEEEHTTSFGGTQDIYLTPAFYDRLGSQVISFGGPDPASPLALRLEHGISDIEAVRTAVASLPGGADLVVDVSESDAAGAVATARQAISVETAALMATAGLLALAAVLLIGQSLVRLAQAAAAELVVLRALGLRRRELLIAGAAPGLVAVVIGAALAVAVAVAASPLTPIGMARQAEISPGVHVDAAVLLFGALTIVVTGAALALLAAGPAVRATAPVTDAPSHRRSVADRLAGLGAPLPAVLGARFAGGGDRSSTRAPLRLATATAALAIAGLVAVATFGASLHQLRAEPAAQGAAWDLAVGNINLSDYTDGDIARMDADPVVDGVAAVAAAQGGGTVDGRDATIAGFDSVSGEVGPPLVDGRLPTSPGEVLLGHRTARAIGAAVGDRVSVAYAGQEIDAEVVGTGVVGPSITPSMLIGDGALVTVAQMRELSEGQPVTFLLLDVAPEVSIGDAIAALRPTWGRNVDVPIVAADVVNLDRVRGIPVALAVTLAAAALVLEGAALVLSGRRRRTALATLRALGATRGQLRLALAWQAGWLYGVAVLIGVPAGIVAGRVLWRWIADGVGVRIAPTLPPADVLVVVAVGLVAVVGFGLLSGEGRRGAAARALRTE